MTRRGSDSSINSITASIHALCLPVLAKDCMAFHSVTKLQNVRESVIPIAAVQKVGAIVMSSHDWLLSLLVSGHECIAENVLHVFR